MSLASMRGALDLIAAYDSSDFVGPIPEELIADAQSMLGIRFLPSYVLFLKELGCGDVGGVEFYGIVGDDLNVPGVPNAIWLTLEERKTGLPKSHIVVSGVGDGSFYAIDTSQGDENGESPVLIVGPGLDVQPSSDSFGAFMLDELQSVLHD